MAFATIPDSGGVIHGCYKKSGGAVRVIDSSVTSCVSNETALDWNIRGPAGPQGAIGPEGPQGAEGPQGPAGPGTKTIAGLVDSTGVVREGTGFTVAKSGTGRYSVIFPPGTFSSFVVMTVNAYGSFGNLGEIIVGGGEPQADGRVVISVEIQRSTFEGIDNSFNFIAAES